MRFRIFILPVLALLIAGCRQATSLPRITATSEKTPPESEALIITAMALPPKPSISPPASTEIPAVQACVPVSDSVSLDEITFEDAPEQILAFLNQGGSPGALQSALELAGLANPPVAAAQGDLTGDQRSDIAVAIFNPASQGFPPPGTLLIYACQENQYALLHRQPSPEGLGGPQIWFMQDLNGDGLDELVVGFETCGAHTCFQDLQVLVWNREVFENRLKDGDSGLPYPRVDVADVNNDGLYEVLITGTGFGSVGAGPQREFTEVYSFSSENGNWIKTNDFLGSSDYRIHVAHDADRAALAGDYSNAESGYVHVISDPELQGWTDPQADGETSSEWENLAAYARFRLAALYLLQDQPDAAQSQIESLAADGQGGPAQGWYEMALALKAGYQSGGITSGCAAARDYAAAHPGTTVDTLQYGYGNPTYSPADLCPW